MQKYSAIISLIFFRNNYKKVIQFLGIVLLAAYSVSIKSADIKLFIPKAAEAEGIVPTASTTAQLALGDSLAIASMKYKKFDKMDFKKLHPAGSLGAQLKTVEDIMITGDKIPFVRENVKMKQALKILSEKKLSIQIVRNKSYMM